VQLLNDNYSRQKAYHKTIRPLMLVALDIVNQLKYAESSIGATAYGVKKEKKISGKKVREGVGRKQSSNIRSFRTC